MELTEKKLSTWMDDQKEHDNVHFFVIISNAIII
jgi:hypothetical protein